MGFKVKRSAKQEGSPKDEKKNGKLAHDAGAAEAGPKDGDGPDEKHGGFQDSEQELQHKAGKDMLDAIESGDPERVFQAHRSMHKVHLMTRDDAEGGGNDTGSPDVHKSDDVVSAIRSMKIGGV